MNKFELTKIAGPSLGKISWKGKGTCYFGAISALINNKNNWDGGVARLVKRRTQDQKTRGSNPVRSTGQICESFSESRILC